MRIRKLKYKIGTVLNIIFYRRRLRLLEERIDRALKAFEDMVMDLDHENTKLQAKGEGLKDDHIDKIYKILTGLIKYLKVHIEYGVDEIDDIEYPVARIIKDGKEKK